MSLPLSVFENMLHNNPNNDKTVELAKSLVEAIEEGSYIIELESGECVTINKLIRFYEGSTNDKKPKQKTKVSSEQSMEGTETPKKRGAGRKRPNNKKEALQDGKPASSRPKS